MRILFYIEPVAFAGNPKALSPIMNIVRCIINGNQLDDTSYGIATSASLYSEYNRWLRYGGKLSLYRSILNEREILEEFYFDIRKYANFLFNGVGNCAYLSQHFKIIFSEFDPDVVVSFTQNYLIEQMRGNLVTLFSERGPMPRWNGRDNFYFDPTGHQPGSFLATRGKEVLGFAVPEHDALGAISKFRDRYDAMTSRADACSAFCNWLELSRSGRPVAMIANQPHESLLVKGATQGLDLSTFMMRTMADLPADWMAFGTYHVDMDMDDCSILDERLAAAFPNYISLPPEFRQFGADPFSAEVDGLITIGSKAALPALLLGKKVIVNPRTMFGGIASNEVGQIDAAPSLSPLEAGRLLAFLASRYTVPNEYLFEHNGYWLDQIERLRTCQDIDAYMLDASDWDAGSIDRMYGLPS